MSGCAAVRVLILGGTGEARELACALAADGGWDVITSLAGRTRNPVRPPGRVRIGGFGGVDGLWRYLAEERIDILVDATHPYAAVISAHAAQAAARAGVARVQVLRPPWRPEGGSSWRSVSDLAAAARVLPVGARVFLTVGSGDAPAFGGRDDVFFLVRVIDAPAAPLPLGDHALVLGRGPFRCADEAALMRRHRITHLVSKNSGGTAAWPKIPAACALGIPVVMVERRPPPPGPCISDAAAAAKWLTRARDAARGRAPDHTGGCR